MLTPQSSFKNAPPNSSESPLPRNPLPTPTTAITRTLPTSFRHLRLLLLLRPPLLPLPLNPSSQCLILLLPHPLLLRSRLFSNFCFSGTRPSPSVSLIRTASDSLRGCKVFSTRSVVFENFESFVEKCWRCVGRERGFPFPQKFVDDVVEHEVLRQLCEEVRCQALRCQIHKVQTVHEERAMVEMEMDFVVFQVFVQKLQDT